MTADTANTLAPQSAAKNLLTRLLYPNVDPAGMKALRIEAADFINRLLAEREADKACLAAIASDLRVPPWIRTLAGNPPRPTVEAEAPTPGETLDMAEAAFDEARRKGDDIRECLRKALIAARPLPLAPGSEKRVTLFRQGPFTLHGGAESMWKVDCDGLTDADWETLAEMALSILPPFSSVVGIPRGGARLQYALGAINPHGHGNPRLIVDDVLTTGGSMVAAMDRPDDIGLVVFARGPLPPRVTALFAMPGALSPPQPAEPKADGGWIETLKRRLDYRLNDYLVEMKPNYDDSITGFNEAWDVMNGLFKEALTAVRPKDTHPPQQQSAEPVAWARDPSFTWHYEVGSKKPDSAGQVGVND